MVQIPTLGCIIAFSAPRQDFTAAGQIWQTWRRPTNFNMKGIHGKSYAQKSWRATRLGEVFWST